MSFRTKLAALAVGAMLYGVAVASAAVSSFSIPGGTTVGGQPVSADVTFTTSAGSVHIALTNDQANPTSVIQNLSDLQFVLSSGDTSGSLTGSSGLERNVATNGTFSDPGTAATGWELESFPTATPTGLRLHVLGTPIGPEHTIIGPPGGGGTYSNANGSIAGNDPHNPFLAGTVTFDVSAAGITAATTVTGGFFSFGTAEGNDVPFGGPPVPLPAAAWAGMALMGSLGGVKVLRRNRA